MDTFNDPLRLLLGEYLSCKTSFFLAKGWLSKQVVLHMYKQLLISAIPWRMGVSTATRHQAAKPPLAPYVSAVIITICVFLLLEDHSALSHSPLLQTSTHTCTGTDIQQILTAFKITQKLSNKKLSHIPQEILRWLYFSLNITCCTKEISFYTFASQLAV